MGYVRLVVTMQTTYYVGEFSKTFAAIVSARLAESGVTQNQIAERLGRTRSYVGKRLRGEAPLSLDVVDAVSQLLPGVSSPRQFVRDIVDEIGRYPEVWASREGDLPAL